MELKQVPYLVLNNGQKMPSIGLGTWMSKPGEVGKAVKDAIDIGYRHIDTAYFYQNEKEVGQAVNDKINDGTVKREELFITTKLWNTFHNPDLVEKACRLSLENLGLAYLDLYLMHFPTPFLEGDSLTPLDKNGQYIPSDYDYVETYLEMEKLVNKGLVKSIGVSNFNHRQLERVLERACIVPVINQVECHPYLAQKKLSAWMKERHIELTSYSPLGSPTSPLANPEFKVLLKDPLLPQIASKYGKTVAQILLRYHIERGFSVIPKSISKNRLKENFDIFDFKLSHQDMEKLLELDCNIRYLALDNFDINSKYHPFNCEF